MYDSMPVTQLQLLTDADSTATSLLPSVIELLEQTFAAGFSEANLKQKLALIEAIALTLREGGCFLERLMGIKRTESNIPTSVPFQSFVNLRLKPGVLTPAPLQVNEGLKLMAVLHAAIVEDYYVAKYNNGKRETIDDYAGEAIIDRYIDPEELNIDL